MEEDGSGAVSQNLTGAETGTRVCRVFVHFSGSSRKGSVSSWAKKLGSRMGITVQVEMIDIKVRPNWDLTKSKNRQLLLNKIRSGRYFAILISPPCSTFTRATWSNRKGPRPVRSYVQPRGLQRLIWSERQKAKWGNELTDFSFEVCIEVSETDTMLLFENPEDLGAVQQGNLYGQRPASMWQWPTFFELLEQSGWETVAFYQADFGTEYLKPTRLLLKGFQFQQQSEFVPGKPTFDEQGFLPGSPNKETGGTTADWTHGQQLCYKRHRAVAQCAVPLDSFSNFGEVSYLSRFGLRRGSTKCHNNFGKNLQPQNQKVGRHVGGEVNQGSADPLARSENSMMVQV